MKLYSILGDAPIINTTVVSNPSPSTGNEFVFTITMQKTISTASRDDAITIMDGLIGALTIYDPNNELSEVQAERSRIEE